MRFMKDAEVYVVAKVEKQEGWLGTWEPWMDEFVGNGIKYKVYHSAGEGVYLVNPSGIVISGEFPSYSLSIMNILPLASRIFKTGDIVTVVRKVVKEAGWKASWVKQMDKYVGDDIPYKVKSISMSSGVCLDLSSDKNNPHGHFFFPHSALEFYVDSFKDVRKVTFDINTANVFSIDPLSLDQHNLLAFVARTEFELNKLKIILKER